MTPMPLDLSRYARAQRVPSAQTIASVTTLVAAGVAFLVIPGSLRETSLGVLDASFAPLWLAGLIAAGLVTLVGYATLHPRIEVCGLLFLSASIAAAALAVVDVRDVQFIPPALIYASVALGLAGRIHDVVSQARIRARYAASAATIAAPTRSLDA